MNAEMLSTFDDDAAFWDRGMKGQPGIDNALYDDAFGRNRCGKPYILK